MISLMCTLCIGLRAQDTLRYSVNLHNATDGSLIVHCKLPGQTPTSTGSWKLPAMVPGTYKIYDFGRFVDSVILQSEAITLQTQAPNTWIFSGAATDIDFTYRVKDTWQMKEDEKDIFHPAGTRFMPGKVFLINPFAVFGYLDGSLQLPIRVEFIMPDSLFPGTAMPVFEQYGDTIVFVYENYHSLADQPLLIAKPETARLKFGDTQVLCMLYDPENVSSARSISQHLKPMLDAQEQYLGGKLPVPYYAFLIYLDPDFNPFASYGALEHNHSSVYYMPAVDETYLLDELRDIAAHEFLHIVTPLNIHSEQIHNFNYDKPEMSRHLWLYEGVTEYTSALVQVQYDLISENKFLEWIQGKIESSEMYNDSIPFTTMSLGVLDVYENEYQNVYEKGALIGMCLDLILHKCNPELKGINGLLQKLSAEYGKDKPFQDEALFDEIERLSCAEAGAFLRKHVGGDTPLPLQELLQSAGYLYAPEKKTKGFTLGGIELGANDQTQRLQVLYTGARDEFGKKIGYKTGDEIAAINGTRVVFENLEEVFTQFFDKLKEGDEVSITLARPNKKGKFKEIVKKANMPMVEYTDYHYLKALPSVSSEQLELKNAWLNRVAE